jgi:hypothetical protein
MLDSNKIFNLFSPNKNFDIEDFNNIRNTPGFKIGLFKKLILNHINFSMGLYSYIEKLDLDLSYDEVKKAGEFFVLNRSYECIKDLNLEDNKCIEAITKYSDDFLIIVLNFAINFFEKNEEYEKCAFLKKIYDIAVQ